MKTKFVVLSLNLCLTLFSQVVAQSKIDSIQANNYYSLADSLSKNIRYDSSNNMFRKAALLYKKIGAEARYYKCFNKISENLWRSGSYLESKTQSEKIISEYPKLDAERAEAFINLGIATESLGDFKEALNDYHKAIAIQEVLTNALPLLSKSYSNIGINHYYQNQYDSALKYFHKTINTSPEKKNIQMLGVYNNMASVFDHIFNYDSAMYYYSKALSIAQLKLNKHHPFVGNILGNVGLIHSYIGELNLAIEYGHQALEVYTTLGTNHPSLIELYNNLGLFHQQLGNLEKALDFFNKSQKLAIRVLGEAHPKVGVSYYNLATTNMMKSKFSPALTELKLAMKIEENSNGNSDHMALVYGQLGKLYFKLNLEESGLHYYNKSLDILTKQPYSKQEYISSLHFIVGEYYFQNKRHKKTLEFLQKSLIENSINFSDTLSTQNPHIDDCYIPMQQLESIYLKGLTFEQVALFNSSDFDIRLAIRCLERSDSILTKVQYSYRRHKDKMTINDMSKNVYESLIRLNFRLHKSTGERQYLENAMLYSEKNKAKLLAKNLTNNANKLNELIENEDIYQEVQMSNNINYYRSKLLQHLDTATTIKYRDLLFSTKIKRDSLISSFEQNYPNYYRLKYDTKTISVEEVQSQILNENQALIEYFLADSSLYIFAITKNYYEVKKVAIDSIFHSRFDRFRKQLQSPKLTNQTIEDFNKYTVSAHALYQYLLAPIADLIKGKDLIIVPDDKLALIPFEALLTTNSEQETINYNNLPYVLRSHNISYANSATTLLNNVERSESKKATSEVFAFAPSFDNGLLALAKQDTIRSGLGPLGWTVKEIKSLASYFDTNIYVGLDATEKAFKENAEKYDIIHIASHGLVDDENPMYSKIAFALDEKDTLNDGYLHTFELYNTQLNAGMVVLSACNTGYGKIQKGEGVMSLGYAFAYAGVPSVVMSHWQVDDKSTYLLMDNYYRYLADGMTKSEALRKAKLALLENENIAYANPYYWGAFVAYGDDSPIIGKPISKMWYVIVLGIVAFIAVLYYRKEKQRKQV